MTNQKLQIEGQPTKNECDQLLYNEGNTEKEI